MTRRVTFSSGHRYWFAHLDDAGNRDLFGPWASPFNHGHNYILDVMVVGSVEPTTGMVVNIKRVDDSLKSLVIKKFDQRSINDEVHGFEKNAPSTENLLIYLWDILAHPGALPTECELVALRLEETPTLYGELEDKVMTLTRTYEFAASHRLDSPHLGPQENQDLFGKCNNLAGHGHNYVLEVTIQGDPAPQTGMIADLSQLDQVVLAEVVDRYDHKNLDADIPEFKGRITTSEVVSQEIFSRLLDKVPAKLHRIRLWETARNMFEVSADR